MRKALGITMALCAVLLLASCQSTMSSNVGTVTVAGQSSVSISPDMASFSVSVESTAETTGEAQAATNERMDEVYRILMDDYGISGEDLRTTAMSLYPEYRYEDGQQVLIGQTASQSVSVTVHELDDLAPIVDSLSTVSGISLSSISLDASDKSQAGSEARRLAMEDAIERAADYAHAAGMELGSPIQIQEGGVSTYVNRIQPTALYAAATDESASAKASYYAGELQVSAAVSVTFSLDW